MVKGVNPNIPYNGYPGNATGAVPVTKDNASYCYDAQRPYIAKNYSYMTSEDKPNYTWPVVGVVVSYLSLLAVNALRKGKP